MNIKELIEQLNRLGEQEKIEAKTGTDVGRSILETVCAFANEPELGGGHILLGLQKHPNLIDACYKIIGVAHPEKIAEDLVSQCRTIFNIPVSISVDQQIIDGKIVVGIFIPEANAGGKPIYFKNQGTHRGAFRRMGSRDVQCTEDS